MEPGAEPPKRKTKKHALQERQSNVLPVPQLMVRGVRGAVQAQENTPEAILSATRAVLLAMIEANPTLVAHEIASIFFTMTPDLDAVHPALAARQLGWGMVPLLCAQEIPVPNSLARVVRVLLHWNTSLRQEAIQHVYLGATAVLRPDINGNPLHPNI